jgi:hypothetical protein
LHNSIHFFEIYLTTHDVINGVMQKKISGESIEWQLDRRMRFIAVSQRSFAGRDIEVSSVRNDVKVTKEVTRNTGKYKS